MRVTKVAADHRAAHRLDDQQRRAADEARERRPRQEAHEERQPEQPHDAQDQADEQGARRRAGGPLLRRRVLARELLAHDEGHEAARPDRRLVARPEQRVGQGREQAGVGASDRGHAAEVRVRQRLREQDEAERDPAGDVVPEPREVVGLDPF